MIIQKWTVSGKMLKSLILSIEFLDQQLEDFNTSKIWFETCQSAVVAKIIWEVQDCDCEVFVTQIWNYGSQNNDRRLD